MFGTLSGIIGLWSAPVTKCIVSAVLIGVFGLYIYILKSDIEQQQLIIANKNQKLITQQAEITSLSESVVQANNATNAALLEIESREQLAAQRLSMISQLRNELSQFEQSLMALEQTNEHVKSWADEFVPVAIISLLNNAANSQNSNSNSGEENKSTTAVNTELFGTRHERGYEQRLSHVNWPIVSVNQSLQF